MTDVSKMFADLLAEQRESLNERFALRLRAGARIDTASFFTHMRTTIDPLIQSVHNRFPERASAVLTALYDASLDLFAASLLGPECKLPAMNRVWTELLPNAIAPLARDTSSLVGCLCNALYQIASQRGARPELWLDRIKLTLPHCTSLSEITDAGLVIAWQSGMPQFREPALARAAQIKHKTLSIALGLPEDTSAMVLTNIIESFQKDRWYRCGSPEVKSKSPTISPVAQAGAFIGFGGLFPRPPKVCCSGNRLIVSVGDNVYWQMIADAFGVWFRRIPETKIKAEALPREIALDSQGNMRWGKATLKVPHLAESSSIACDGVALAITIPTSHHLFLFAQTGAAA